MRFFKRNQIIIYVIVLMIMTAGYLNYTTNTGKEAVETSMQMESKDDMQIADIGDATLVNSNDVVSESANNEKDNSTKDIDNNPKDEYFVKSKLERDSMYSQMIETYEKVLNSNNSLEMQKQTATQEIQKINDIKNSIMISENLIKTKGFENSIIFANGESISVIVEIDDELKQEQIAQIQNIISREMNAKIENIHISAK